MGATEGLLHRWKMLLQTFLNLTGSVVMLKNTVAPMAPNEGGDSEEP